MGVFVGSTGSVADGVAGVVGGTDVAVLVGTIAVKGIEGLAVIGVIRDGISVGLVRATTVGSVGISCVAKKIAANTVRVTTIRVPAPSARRLRTEALFSFEESCGRDKNLPHF